MMRMAPSRALYPPSSLLSATIRRSRPQSLASGLRPAFAVQQQQSRQQHAVSNPTLANIEKRWEAMPPQEQAQLWMALRDRMTVDWHELTMQEKKASYWIAFGPHGPRALPDPKEKWRILQVVILCVAASGGIFAVSRFFSRGSPKTMTQEWQEMTNEYLKAQKTEAITGVSSEGYAGKGYVQSPPSGKKPGEDEE